MVEVFLVRNIKVHLQQLVAESHYYIYIVLYSGGSQHAMFGIPSLTNVLVNVNLTTFNTTLIKNDLGEYEC